MYIYYLQRIHRATVMYRGSSFLEKVKTLYLPPNLLAVPHPCPVPAWEQMEGT